MAKVTMHKDDDPAIEAATKAAKSTFRYFWRELSWEYRRIIPGLDLAAFKVGFRDDDDTPAEVMWVNEVTFDGYSLNGNLLNQPNWLKSVNQGDPVKVPTKAITDWLYTMNGVAYGGFSVNAIRNQMSSAERNQHDKAWGLDFGDPLKVHVVPPSWFGAEEPKKKGLFGKKGPAPEPITEEVLQAQEHPMAANMAPALQKFASENPSDIGVIGDNGLNMLHELTLAGTALGVQTMLEAGVDVNSKTRGGHTSLDLARSMGWKKAYQTLASSGGVSAIKK